MKGCWNKPAAAGQTPKPAKQMKGGLLKYRLRIAEETVTLDLSDAGGKQDMQFAINGKEYNVRCNVLSVTHFHLLVNGRATEAFVVRGDNNDKQVCINGRSFLVRDEYYTPSRRARQKSPEEVPGEVTPPMPSVVIRIMAAEGDTVKKGQGLLVVSAMKMETTLVSPSNGRVKKVNTFVNAKVAPGDILVEIEREGTGNE